MDAAEGTQVGTIDVHDRPNTLEFEARAHRSVPSAEKDGQPTLLQVGRARIQVSTAEIAPGESNERDILNGVAQLVHIIHKGRKR